MKGLAAPSRPLVVQGEEIVVGEHLFFIYLGKPLHSLDSLDRTYETVDGSDRLKNYHFFRHYPLWSRLDSSSSGVQCVLEECEPRGQSFGLPFSTRPAETPTAA